MTKRTKLLVLLLAACVIAGVALYSLYQHHEWTTPEGIRVSGNIEVTDAQISFRLPGQVIERRVSEGERIEAGEVAARLDTEDLEQEAALREAEGRAARASLAELEAGSRPQEIASSEAAVEQARAKLSELEAGSRAQSIAAAEAALESVEAELERTRSDFERQQTLLERDVISEREFESSQSAYRVASARYRESLERLDEVREGPRRERIEEARNAVREAEEQLELVREGPREENIDQARARVEQAEAAMELAQVRLSHATATAPFSGIVLSENVEPGEYVSPGTPVVTIGDMERVWLRAYIDQTDLGRVRVGQPVSVTTDTYPDKAYPGRISFISSEAEFTPKTVQTERERVKLVYRIKVTIPNPDMELKPGMPADGLIHLEGEDE